MSKNKRIAPNVIRGGVAIPLGSNYFLMKGRTHREGGIDVGKDLEVEDGELMKVTKNNIKVLSDQPIFNGISPAKYAINGNIRKRFNKAFKAQEKFKKIYKLNDDGTKKELGGEEEEKFSWDNALFEGNRSPVNTKDLADRDKEYINERDSILMDTDDADEIIKKIEELNSKINSDSILNDEHKNVLIEDNNHIKQYPISHAVVTRNNHYWSERDKIDEENTIPFISEKFVELHNAGKSNNVALSTNQLDSLAYHAGKTGLPIRDALGLAAQETTFGKFYGTTFLKNKNDFDNHSASADPDMRTEAFLVENGVRPTFLVNNHHYFNNNPYQSLIGEVSRQIGVGNDTSNGNVSAKISYDQFNDDVENAMRKGFNYTLNQMKNYNLNEHPLDDAFKYYQTGNYNNGINGNSKKVIDRGNEVMNSPEIQEWLKNSGEKEYNRGVKDKKFGGMNIKSKNKQTIPSTGKKTKVEMGVMKVDEDGNLIADIEPAVVIGEKRNIIREMIISELLKDSLKLKRDKTVKTNKIKAELGTQTKPKESIAEIVKRITEESQAASNKLAAKITKFNPPLGNNTIDSRSLFNSKPNTQKVNTNNTTKSISVNTSNNNTSNTSSSSSNNKVVELPKVVVQDIKKEMPKITTKATTADPGIIKVQNTNNKPKVLPKLDSSNLTKNAVVGELKVNKETKPIELPKEMPKITSKAVTKDPGIIIPKKEQPVNTNTLPKIDSSSLTSKAVTKDPGISKPKVQNNREYLQQKLEEESVLKAKDDTKLQSNITKQSDVIDDEEDVVTKPVKIGNKVSFFQANPTFIPNLIGTGINVAGSLISHNINKKFLNSLEEPKAPYLLQPTKLKTRINVKPQVDELRRTVRRYNKYFDKNTASSQTAVGRRLNNEQIFIDAFNQIKGNQENQETSLINQDRTQQHETAKFNLTNYNQWLRDKTNFKNTILEKKAENNTALVQNIAGSATNFIDKENQWKRDMMTIAAISAGNPNVSADQLADLGLPYAKYMAQRRKNR